MLDRGDRQRGGFVVNEHDILLAIIGPEFNTFESVDHVVNKKNTSLAITVNKFNEVLGLDYVVNEVKRSLKVIILYI